MKYFKVLLVAIVAIAFLSGCSDKSDSAAALTDSGKLAVESDTVHDWGDINIAGGTVSHTFAMKNESEKPLYLKGATTSCMCTQARYRFTDKAVSPQFGMHNSAQNWLRKVKPGETFNMEVVFDPMAHGPKATGPIERTVELFTSDLNGMHQLRLKGDVLSEQDYRTKYPEGAPQEKVEADQ